MRWGVPLIGDRVAPRCTRADGLLLARVSHGRVVSHARVAVGRALPGRAAGRGDRARRREARLWRGQPRGARGAGRTGRGDRGQRGLLRRRGAGGTGRGLSLLRATALGPGLPRPCRPVGRPAPSGARAVTWTAWPARTGCAWRVRSLPGAPAGAAVSPLSRVSSAACWRPPPTSPARRSERCVAWPSSSTSAWRCGSGGWGSPSARTCSSRSRILAGVLRRFFEVVPVWCKVGGGESTEGDADDDGSLQPPGSGRGPQRGAHRRQRGGRAVRRRRLPLQPGQRGPGHPPLRQGQVAGQQPHRSPLLGALPPGERQPRRRRGGALDAWRRPARGPSPATRNYGRHDHEHLCGSRRRLLCSLLAARRLGLRLRPAAGPGPLAPAQRLPLPGRPLRPRGPAARRACPATSGRPWLSGSSGICGSTTTAAWGTTSTPASACARTRSGPSCTAA